MYCLLCHEKIPRLRAWRTKSEFCSDEHAAQYKKQTLDRLLTDQNPARKEKPDPIALSAEPEDDLLHDEMSIGGAAPEPSSLDDLVAQARAEAKPESDAEDPLAVSADRDAADDSADGVEELWRLAEEIDHSDSDMELLGERGGGGSFEPDVSRQSAEDALRALRMLAEKATESDGAHDRESLAEQDSPSFLRDYFDGDDPPRSLEEIEELPPLSDDLFAELGDELPDFEDPSRDSDPVAAAKDALSEDILSEEDDSTDAAAGSPAPAAGGMQLADDAPSILDRLMEAPSSNWSQKSPATSAPPPVSREKPPAADHLDDDPLADFADLPEPDFAFEDDLLEAAEASEEPVSGEPQIDDAPLADVAAAADNTDDEPQLDPLAELIKAEEAAQIRGEDEDDDSAFDEAVADELVKELAEQALRDDLDLQELERNLKVVPFPSPSNSATSNGRHKHTDHIADDIDDAIESHPLPAKEPIDRTAAAQRPPARARPPRPGGTRTRFKPSMVMAGVEPAIQGYLQGDPLESWRVSAVESAWGQRGLPSIHSFEAASPTHAPSSGLEALRPDQDFRGRMSLPLTVCTPAEAPAVDAPTTSLEPSRRESAPQSPQVLSLDESASIRLGPEYRAFDDIAAVTMNLDAVADAEPSDSLRELLAQLPDALEPSAVFYDSVSMEARFVDEDEWDAPVTTPDPTDGIDLSADFADEQPAVQSSGGRRQY